MRLSWLVIPAILILAMPSVPAAASHLPGDEPDGGPVTVKLDSIDQRVPNSATARIRLHLGHKKRQASRLEARVRVRDLPADVSRVYRLWVVNDFVGDGVLLKTFRVDARGNADFRAAVRIRDVWKFRRLVVTLESRRHRERQDSFTHGPVVLEGVQPLEGE